MFMDSAHICNQSLCLLNCRCYWPMMLMHVDTLRIANYQLTTKAPIAAKQNGVCSRLPKNKPKTRLSSSAFSKPERYFKA